MIRYIILSVLSVILITACQSTKTTTQSTGEGSHEHSYSRVEAIPVDPHGFLKDFKPFTIAGKRTGEGYFSADGTHFVFQSEREANNPFYQIYLTNLVSGQTQRVSTGYGKTTCAWVHPSNKKVIFASTHGDPQTRKIMKEEIDFRNSGKKRRYSWDYDEQYDIYSASADGKNIKNLTHVRGYDAEGAYSPNGDWIVFSSNRHAYSDKLSEEDKKKLQEDPSLFLDIYLMKSDGSQVRRLTETLGYDGGPFFSPDGKKIVWRNFETNGQVAEIYTMNLDGTDKKQITRLKSMSWAPYFHPSGDYIVFTTNRHGYKNFELYIVDAAGEKEPVRISYLEDFDGLPVFTPDGNHLTWTRRAQGISQIFISDWDDNKARKLLSLPPSPIKTYELSYKIQKKDMERTVNYLASPGLKGRKAGSPEELLYTKNLEDLFKSYGLNPGFNNSYIHEFEFSAGAELGKNNRMVSTSEDVKFDLEKNWIPLAFSKSGTFPHAPVIFAGYGLVTPETEGFPAYDSYQDANVAGKWVMVFRYVPEDIDQKLRSHYNRYSKLQHKVMMARERGALGIIFVSGPSSKVKNDLIKFNSQENTGELSLPALSISDDIAKTWFKNQKKDLKDIQRQLDKGQTIAAFDLNDVKISASVNIKHKKAIGRNVLALLNVPGAKSTLVIGAHGDHLGQGQISSSLMRSTDTSDIHYGADDNASGVAATIELAHYFSYLSKNGQLKLKQNLMFAIWSAEEIGVLGSEAFLDDYKAKYKKVYPNLSAYLNMDMIGRYNAALYIQGISSSSDWLEVLEPMVQKVNFNVALSDDPYVPTDGMPFYMYGIPSLTFFTGAHEDYHTPRDTPDKLNYEKAMEITELIGNVITSVASNAKPLTYTKVERTKMGDTGGRGFRIYLGTIPDYASGKIKGVALSGVIKGGPAELAGLKKGDVIIELSGKKIENIHDYVYSLETLKPDSKTKITVLREGDKQELDITPKSKE
ncbi:MAG: M28 family peptidase [Bdellovibrionaceae bacterium]|nr:M28 family peptidase [Pseudobdellovibrionaceae bacterium]